MRDAPAFAGLTPDLARRLAGCDLAGFGITGFDLPLLAAEFARAGLPFPLAGRAVLDALAVYRRHEASTLAAAVGLYLGRDHAGAHAAGADAVAAAEVLDAQVARYGLPAAPADLHAALVEVDVAGKFRRGPDGAVVFAFGKHAGRPLADVARTDPDYLGWMLTRRPTRRRRLGSSVRPLTLYRRPPLARRRWRWIRGDCAADAISSRRATG